MDFTTAERRSIAKSFTTATAGVKIVVVIIKVIITKSSVELKMANFRSNLVTSFDQGFH